MKIATTSRRKGIRKLELPKPKKPKLIKTMPYPKLKKLKLRKI